MIQLYSDEGNLSGLFKKKSYFSSKKIRSNALWSVFAKKKNCKDFW